LAGEDATQATRRRYDRIAPLYDAMEWFMELGFRRWRRELWSTVPAGRILEVGVGTGKNIGFHGQSHVVTGIDISPRMLARARQRAQRCPSPPVLELADAQALPYADASFDAVVASFVFCSVPDAIQGFREARRVLVPGGKLLLLEHVISNNRMLAALMRRSDALPFHLWGAHIDRDTASNVREAGFGCITVHPRWLDIVVIIEAERPRTPVSKARALRPDTHPESCWA